MLTKSCLLVASLAVSALAAPPLLQARVSSEVDTPETTEAFSMYANASGLFEGLKPINGNNFGLWIGLPTIDGCPADLTCTEHQNTTVFWSRPDVAPRASQIHMNVAVAGGQILYYDYSGVLHYTAPGENSIPALGIDRTYRLFYGPQDLDLSTPDWGHVGSYSAQYYACPTEVEGVYFVKIVGVAIDPGNCTYIEILGTRWTAGTAAFSYL